MSSEINIDKTIHLIDTSDLADFNHNDPEGIAVIMPCIDTDAGRTTARILSTRAGMACHIFIVHDTLRQGFIKTVNDVAARITVRYIVYLAQDAWPGRGWLSCAYNALEQSGKTLLAFNDGKWYGRIASFGMVRTQWVKTLYGGPLFFPNYASHAADLELTVIAQALDQHVYNPDCTLVEVDPAKDQGGSNPSDKALYDQRLSRGFDGLAPLDTLKTMNHSYPVLQRPQGAPSMNLPGVSVIILTRNGAQHLERLFSTFFKVNTHTPVELIVIDHASTDDTAQVVAQYISKGFIRLIKRDCNYTFSESCNYGAQKAKHPYLLFLNNDIVYTSDALPPAVTKLSQNSDICAVGIRLDDDPASVPEGKTPGVQHLGITFKWNDRRGYYQPEQIRHPDANEMPAPGFPSGSFSAVTAAFLLCRKADFNEVGGFSDLYTYGLEDMDFCLRLGRDLKKQCYCINDMGLQHVEGATRKQGDKTSRAQMIEKNHMIFKEKWADYIQKKFENNCLKGEPNILDYAPLFSSLSQQTVDLQSCQIKVCLEKISKDSVQGWAINCADIRKRPVLYLVKNGIVMGKAMCSGFKKDLYAPDQNKDGFFGFEIFPASHLADNDFISLQDHDGAILLEQRIVLKDD